MKWLFLIMAAVFLTGCDYTEVKREVGHKGKARMNPWLAAERFSERIGNPVRPLISWSAPEMDDMAWVTPASVLGNQSFTDRMEEWVSNGGHLIVLIEHADAATNDWGGSPPPPAISQALRGMLERVRLHLKEGVEVDAEEIRFLGKVYQVNASSTHAVSKGGGADKVFSTARLDLGRITVITDGRIFRNRWIAEKDHAALLAALIENSFNDGSVVFMRGAGLSFWSLLRQYLMPVLLVLMVWLVLWLWKNFSRFGPLESSSLPQQLRGYGRHLEALGRFQWKLDHAASLLGPMRERVSEFGHRACLSAGHPIADLHAFLADRAGLPCERVSRALSETTPADGADLVRTTADLQKLLQALNPTSLS